MQPETDQVTQHFANPTLLAAGDNGQVTLRVVVPFTVGIQRDLAAQPLVAALQFQDDEDGAADRFSAQFVPEGVDTSDGRFIDEQAITWPRLDDNGQLPLQWTPETGIGHMGSVFVGNIVTLRRERDVMGVLWVVGTGEFATDAPGDTGETAREAAELARAGNLTGVSVDLGNADTVLEATEVETNPDGEEEITATRLRIVSAELMGATVVPFPAFGQARILEVGDQPEERTARPLAAAAAPLAPPAEWFTDPALQQPTPLTITDQGRVYGHLAKWGTCHTGSPKDKCVLAPRGEDYAYFLTSTMRTAEGDLVPVGTLTIGDDHADLKAGWQNAVKHYADASMAWAAVTVGEDDHGVWVAGTVFSDVPDTVIARARATALSGDWRPIGGKRRLIAAHNVNAPGFPITAAAAFDNDGHLTALVAAGAMEPCDSCDDTPEPLAAGAMQALIREMQALRAEVARPRLIQEAEQIAAELAGEPEPPAANPLARVPAQVSDG